jgi:hypothetical protein
MHAAQAVRISALIALAKASFGCGGRTSLFDEGDISVGPIVAPHDASATDGFDSSPFDPVDAGGLIDTSTPSSDSGAPFDATVPDASDDAGTDSGSESDGALPSTAACLTGGNVLWVDGDPTVWPWWLVGVQTVSVGSTWNVQAENYYATYDGAILEVRLAGSSPGDPFWYFEFNTWGTGGPMEAGVTYSNSSNPPAGATPIQNGDFSIGYAATCAILSGTFHVQEFTASPGTEEQGIDNLLTFTATFSAVCEQTEVGVLRGCIHYDASNVTDQ